MPTAEARVETDRAKRYLDQICTHAGQMARHPRYRQSDHGSDDSTGPPRVLGVESSDRDGVLTFADGKCTLHADPDALTLRLEAPDEQRLRRLQAMLAKRVETIGRRDRLTVAWHGPDGAPDGAPDAATHTASRKSSRRMAALAILLVKLVVIVLVITLPVGLTALASVHGAIMVGLLVVVAVAVVVHRVRGGTLHDVDLHGLAQLHGLVRTVPRTVKRIVKARTSR